MATVVLSRATIFLFVIFYYCRCNKVEEIIDDQECRNAQVDFVLVIDSSGSVQTVFESYKEAAMDLARMLPIKLDRTIFTIIQYNDNATVKLEFSDSQTVESVNRTLNDLQWLGGMTRSAEAVDLGVSAYYRRGRADAFRIFVLMTDGNSFNTWQRVRDTARRLHATGARIFVVALGDSMYEPELEEYAGTNGTIIKREDFNRFKGEILDLTGYTCHPIVRYKFYYENAPTEVTQPASSETATTISTATTSTSTQTTSAAPAPTSSASTTTTTSIATSSTISSTQTTPATLATSSSTYSTTTSSSTLSTPTSSPSSSTPSSSTTTSSASPSATSVTVPVIISTVPTSPTVPPKAGCPLDILFIVDSSARAHEDFNREISFISDIVDVLTIDLSVHLVAVVEYASELRQRLQFSFTAYLNKNDLIAAIKALPFFSGVPPATSEALRLGKEVLSDRRPSVPAVVFVLTDGFGKGDLSGTSAALRSEPNIDVYAVSLTSAANPNDLGTIAGDSSRVYANGNSTKIKTDVLSKYLNCAVTTTLSTTTSSYAPPSTTSSVATTSTLPPTTSTIPTTTTTIPPPTTTTPTTTTASTTTTTTTTSTNPTIATTTTTTTLPTTTTTLPTTTTTLPTTTTTLPTTTTTLPTTTTTLPTTTTTLPTTTTTLPTTTTTLPTTTEFISTGCLLDLLFVLDSSGSVTQTFRRELEFATSIVDRLIVGSNNAHVAAVKYAGPGKARVVFPFNKFNTAADVKKAILATTFISGTTSTNEALELAVKEYDVSNGARPGEARFLAVVFTDGFSQDDPMPGAKALRAKGATVYAIGINKAEQAEFVHPVNKAELIDIAGDESRVFTDDTIDSLYNALDQLEQACKDQTAPLPPSALTSGATGNSEPTQPSSRSASQLAVQQTPSTGSAGYTGPPRRYPPNLFIRPR